MEIKQASWIHGSSIQIESVKDVKNIQRLAFFTRITGQKNKGTWIHFAVPTPVIIDNDRLKIESAMARFRCSSNAVQVAHFHICDGEERFYTHDHINISSLNWNTPSHQELIRPERTVLWGIGISLYITFDGDRDADNILEFASVGCEFIH